MIRVFCDICNKEIDISLAEHSVMQYPEVTYTEKGSNRKVKDCTACSDCTAHIKFHLEQLKASHEDKQADTGDSAS